jgi:ribA/ribD-fused uncharacterized protein
MSTQNCLFFYGGPLSQWYPSPFTLDGLHYSTAEQYMMVAKASFFGDQDILTKILNTSNPREQKALGRQVRGFDPQSWNTVARQYVMQGNHAKFGQDADLLLYLMTTGDRELVEASPTDCVWGIGLGLDNPDRFDRTKWRGTNWLGLALMSVRTTVRLPS